MIRDIYMFFLGIFATLLAIVGGYIFAPDAMVAPRYTCAVRTLDGCAVWADVKRVERYQNAKAGS